MTEPATARSLERAGLLLDRARLDLRPGVPRDRAVAMLARMLDRYDLAGDEHGRLLVAALRARSKAEQRAGRRPPAEHAVRYLLAHGDQPWPRAVAAVLEREAQHERAIAAQAARLAPIAERDGAAAAQVVVGHWRQHDRAPSPNQLGKALGWGSHDTWALVHLLVEAGWLTVERRRLQPGPRARQAAGRQ